MSTRSTFGPFSAGSGQLRRMPQNISRTNCFYLEKPAYPLFVCLLLEIEAEICHWKCCILCSNRCGRGICLALSESFPALTKRQTRSALSEFGVDSCGEGTSNNQSPLSGLQNKPSPHRCGSSSTEHPKDISIIVMADRLHAAQFVPIIKCR